MKPETIAYLKELANKKTWVEDPEFNPADFSGGNYDDAYSGGNSDGEIQLARTILEKEGIIWKN